MTGQFAGATALVTGAAKGIGQATVAAFAREGATVLAVDREPGPEELQADLGAAAARVLPRVTDLGDSAALTQLCNQLDSGSRVDVLVNCAAAYPPGGVFDTVEADWQRVLQVNVVAAAVLSRAVATRLVRDGRPGSIVNVGSVQEHLPLPGFAAYATSKGALTALTRALAVELGDYGIRVNTVAPGVVNSPTAVASLGSAWGGDGPAAPTLLGRAGTPDEVAEAIVYLASQRSSYITGAVLPVDGGRGVSRRYDSQADPDVGVPGGPGGTSGGDHAHR